MNRNRVTGVLLCEDLQTSVFVKRYFSRKRPNWIIRTDPLFTYEQRMEGGIGNGYVLKNAGGNINELRNRVARFDRTFLIIAIDADNYTLSDVIRLINHRLDEQDILHVRTDERVVLLVPKRNIETWIEYGRGNPVDESTIYSKLNKETDCYPMVDRLAEIRSLPDDSPPSLRHARGELKKIL